MAGFGIRVRKSRACVHVHAQVCNIHVVVFQRCVRDSRLRRAGAQPASMSCSSATLSQRCDAK